MSFARYDDISADLTEYYVVYFFKETSCDLLNEIEKDLNCNLKIIIYKQPFDQHDMIMPPWYLDPTDKSFNVCYGHFLRVNCC